MTLKLLTVMLTSLAFSACGAADKPSPEPKSTASPRSTLTGDPMKLTVVELFQSQGCSSCPPAIANVNGIADRPDVLALTFAVTYWDQLGWKDTFADPTFTERQWHYARASGRPNVFTPQVIVNGRISIVGARREQLDQAVRATPQLTGSPRIDGTLGEVVVRAGKASEPATVWLVRFDPRSQQVAIGRGENGGRTIAHRNVVRQLVKLGRWTGTEARFALPRAVLRHLRSAILIQSGVAGEIVAAKRL